MKQQMNEKISYIEEVLKNNLPGKNGYQKTIFDSELIL